VIGIATHQRWQIEGNAQPRAAGIEQRLVSRVGLLRRAKPRKLPHRPQLAAIARRMDAACVRKGAWMVEVAGGVEAGEVVGRVEAVDRTAGDRREWSRPLRCLRQRRFQYLPFPVLLIGLGRGLHSTSLYGRRGVHSRRRTRNGITG
jgi:hypothetical protein